MHSVLVLQNLSSIFLIVPGEWVEQLSRAFCQLAELIFFYYNIKSSSLIEQFRSHPVCRWSALSRWVGCSKYEVWLCSFVSSCSQDVGNLLLEESWKWECELDFSFSKNRREKFHLVYLLYGADYRPFILINWSIFYLRPRCWLWGMHLTCFLWTLISYNFYYKLVVHYFPYHLRSVECLVV